MDPCHDVQDSDQTQGLAGETDAILAGRLIEEAALTGGWAGQVTRRARSTEDAEFDAAFGPRLLPDIAVDAFER